MTFLFFWVLFIALSLWVEPGNDLETGTYALVMASIVSLA